MEVGELAEDDLHHAEGDDVGARVLAAVSFVPVPVEAVGLEDRPAGQFFRSIIWTCHLAGLINQNKSRDLRGAGGRSDGVADAGAEHVGILADAAEKDVPPACTWTEDRNGVLAVTNSYIHPSLNEKLAFSDSSV